MPKRTLYTTGVYGKTEQNFFEALTGNHITLLVDVRRRRGVRGHLYSFANSAALQARLAELGIGYLHAIEAAPPEDLRELQKQADTREKVGQRKREQISPEFRKLYTKTVLTPDTVSELGKQIVEALGKGNGSACLFCVEAAPEACHRSLVAEALATHFRAKVVHL
jgi:uncharacterized protein (DUF488 family)